MNFNPELFEIFSTDSESEEEGIWVDLTDKIAFKVRSIGAKAVIERREELRRPFQGILKAGGKIPDQKEEEIGRRVIASAVIAGWRGVTDVQGNELPYNEENAVRLLTELPRLANFIITTSTDQESYRQSNRESDAKN